MNEHKSLIAKFYMAFSQLDWQTMSDCYHPEIEFSDPAFPSLKGKEAGVMWRMLCERAKSFELTFKNVSAEGDSGECQWQANYLFSKTGRMVENHISAQFLFRDGKIIHHKDTFDFWKWSKMALGTPGVLLGWSPFLRNKVQQTAQSELQKFLAKNNLV